MSEPAFRSGFVAVVGRPNVGKSTLINALMGEKVSIVTAKPQTTRHRILAIHNDAHAQIIFVDTPGLHRKSDRTMNRVMNRTAAAALADADVILFVIEAGRWTAEDGDVLDRIRDSGKPAIALLNKVDLIHPKDRLLGELDALAKRHAFAELIPISARKHSNLDLVRRALPAFIPESVPLFPESMTTDRSEEFHAAELIREKLTLALHQELPYGLTVQIEQYEATSGQVTIHAVVWVERDSQKGIVVGKGGERLKQIGRAARLELRERLGVPVHLELWVKVKKNWADNEKDLVLLGFETGQ